MRWLALVVILAAELALADPTGSTPKPADSGSGSGSGVDRMADPKTPLTSLTDDPLLGHSPRINGDEVHGVVAFTFDDGPNPETTPAVIGALEKYDIPATFFIVTQRLLGKHGAAPRDLLTHELADHFLVGSHSVSHKLLKTAGPDLVAKEMDASFRTLAKEADRPIGLFRPPYGALSGAGRARLRQLGVTEVIWSIDTLDWKAHDADKLRKKVLKMILHDNGGVVLMHDVKPITAKIIAGVLDDLEAENCSRLAAKPAQEPIWPVSIHYFLRDAKNTSRAVPAEVQKRTDAYKVGLPNRCKNRAPVKEDSNPCLVNPLAKGCS
ncbi:MAG TPA: polysaccharide deacetylase family protein [Kofleriaceae bacterium]|nr:polysaccharide deacetylase family protein [Kofleriaceae bacterium]